MSHSKIINYVIANLFIVFAFLQAPNALAQQQGPYSVTATYSVIGLPPALPMYIEISKRNKRDAYRQLEDSCEEGFWLDLDSCKTEVSLSRGLRSTHFVHCLCLPI